MTADIPLFSYGTLQMREVQLANYGRTLDGSPDALAGYRLEILPDRDPDAVRISGRLVANDFSGALISAQLLDADPETGEPVNTLRSRANSRRRCAPRSRAPTWRSPSRCRCRCT